MNQNNDLHASVTSGTLKHGCVVYTVLLATIMSKFIDIVWLQKDDD